MLSWTDYSITRRRLGVVTVGFSRLPILTSRCAHLLKKGTHARASPPKLLNFLTVAAFSRCQSLSRSLITSSAGPLLCHSASLPTSRSSSTVSATYRVRNERYG